MDSFTSEDRNERPSIVVDRRPNSAPATFSTTEGKEQLTKPIQPQPANTDCAVEGKSETNDRQTSAEIEEPISRESSMVGKRLCVTREQSAAYDKALKYYGWRMQIPGDPLKLK
ncbi:hypothetical protein FBUS_00755 [Fasciolopsis buskii]|uniref:Uncharacterized protein n=1 Tax=Fasciolopsis buskii TaxID=27845 RepID=A0A8E0VIS7_9TREM|nr:hypothetical protein FBUS_00755 [Fasciolopsis buski]